MVSNTCENKELEITMLKMKIIIFFIKKYLMNLGLNIIKKFFQRLIILKMKKHYLE